MGEAVSQKIGPLFRQFSLTTRVHHRAEAATSVKIRISGQWPATFLDGRRLLLRWFRSCVGENYEYLWQAFSKSNNIHHYYIGYTAETIHFFPCLFQDNVWRKFKAPKGVVVPKGRRSHTATVFQDSMYIYGGYQDLKGSTSELWAFHFGKEYLN